MARIAHQTILETYDRLTEQMLARGGRSLSRDEAAAFAAELKGGQIEDLSKGFVAEAVFDLIDRMDAGPGAQVTRADVAATRAFIQGALAKVDVPRNGLSAAELAALPELLKPLAQGLIMIAKIDDAHQRPGPMSHRPFREGIRQVVNLIKNADGGNRRVSDAEIDRLTADLQQQGRFAEALAVRNLFTIAKKQDGDKNIVGHDDLDGAAAWAIAQIKKRDRGAPGFSDNEIADFPPTWRALGHVGFAIEAGVIEKVSRTRPAPNSDAEALSNKLEAIVDGEFFISESDYPFEAYHQKLARETPLNDDTFRQIHQVPADVVVFSFSAKDFFEYYQDADEHSVESAAKFRTLEREMKASLRDIKIFKIGDEAQVEVKWFLVGRTQDGSLAGLRSLAIET